MSNIALFVIRSLIAIPVVVVALSLSLATAPIPATAAPPSMPGDVQMVQPDPSLPKELAAFSGKWEGSGLDTAKGQIQFFLIVEEITKEMATLRVWHSVHGWSQREAEVANESGKYKLRYKGPFGKNVITSTGAGLVFDAQHRDGKASWFTINLKRAP
ncbi:MAG: hypothetical protein IH606_19145 [Burkholderiales bacterium]|nr:hypothetical protein [Burkholderiales bacterium]